MQSIKGNRLVFGGFFALGGAIAGMVLNTVAQSVPQPGLTITPTGTNQVLIIITNGVSYANYEIFRTPLLGNSVYQWTLHIEGALGQTNFIADKGMMLTGFFKAGVGSDWDGDGIPNNVDANPSDAAVGALTITIDTPANGTVFN